MSPSEKLVQELTAKPVACSGSFVEAAAGLRDHLAALHIDLAVVLLPGREAVQRDEAAFPGALAEIGWTKPGALIMDAETKLAARGIRVCNLLPVMHGTLVRRPDTPLYRDSAHLNHLGIGLVGRQVASWAGWRSETEDGSSAMWLGDCHVTHIRKYQEDKGFGHPQACWRNASANQMAHEAGLLQAEDFGKVKTVLWLIESEYLENSIFPPVVAATPRGEASEEKVCTATITKTSHLPGDLGPASPYPDAITVIEFTAADGSTFMGLTFAMQNHVVDEAVQKEWLDGGRFRLTLKPWELACRETKGLANLRQLDDQTNFSAPRYWISHWQRLD